MSASALQATPKLREDLDFVRRESREGVHYIVKDPVEGKYSRFGEPEVVLMRLMDGTRTPEQIADAAHDRIGGGLEPGAIADFAQRLKRLGLVERTAAEQHLMLMEHLRSQRRVRAGGRTRGSLLRIRFSLGDPDRLFERAVGPLRWVWTPGFVVLSSVLFVIYAVLLVIHSGEIYSGAKSLYTTSGANPVDYALGYLLFLITGGIHELGHGLTTKRFGGEVHEIGGMFLYFTPALFCNTNDAWMFERRSHRLWVTFAGPWIQVFVAAIACLVWVFLEPGTLAYRLAFLTVLVGGVTGVLGNLNPLIPLDGYYALSDWLEIPNLRRRAFGYWSWLTKRYLLNLDVEEPTVTPRERRVFLLYGGLALAYSVLAVLFGLAFLGITFEKVIGPWAWVLLALLFARLIVARLPRLRELGRAVASTVRSRFERHRKGVFAGAFGFAVVLAVPFLVPWTFRADGEFRVEAVGQFNVTAGADGSIERVFVAEGDTVESGQPLIEIWNGQLEVETARAARRAAELRVDEARALAAGGREAAAKAAAVRSRIEREARLLRDRRDRLTVQAPVAGVVLAYRLEERVGERVSEGDRLLVVAPLRGNIARAGIPAREARGIAPGQRARLKVSAWPAVVYDSRVASVAPAALDDRVEAMILLPESEEGPDLRPGMTGTVKIVTGQGTVAEAVTRVLRRMIRVDLAL